MTQTVVTPHHIGINGWFLQHPFTGIGQYTIQLLREFSKMKTENEPSVRDVEFLVVVPDDACVQLMRDEQITLPVHVLPEISWMPRSFQKHIWEQIQLPKFFTEQQMSTVWLPYPCATWFTTPSYRTVVTVHDAIPWTMPQYRTGVLSSLAHAMSLRATHTLPNRTDNAIITVSETSAEDIVGVCEIPRERIQVIWNGVSDIFKTPADPQLVTQILQEYDLTRGNYFLYVGGYDARKRVAKLVESYQQYGNGNEQAKLVLVGGKSYDTALYRDFDRAADAASNTTASLTASQKSDTISVVRTGFLEESHLNALYEGCRAFLHFSEQEGFNIPLAQALVKNLPCGVSDIPVHREIAGNRAIYTNPDDAVATASLWRTLCTLTPPTVVPSQTSSAARDAFSWTTSAREHLRVF